MTPLTIEKLVQDVPDLPALPTAVVAVLRETDGPNATSNSVAAQILKDQGLSARLLRLSNSAYYGLSREVGKVQDAVTILGFRTVRSLVLVAGTYPLLKKGLDGYGMEAEALWKHSTAVAIGAQTIAQQTEVMSPDTAFCVGLLHDIGKVALSERLGQHLAQVSRYVEAGSAFDEAERAVFGFDHCDVGAHLAKGWNLPTEFTEGMRWHHRPDDAPEGSTSADVVHLSMLLSMQLGYGLGIDGLGYSASEGAIERLRLDGEAVERIAAKMESEIRAREEFFSAAAV